MAKIYIDRSIREKISMPWNDALIVKLLGKEVSFLVMKDKLQKLWKPTGYFDILDPGHGFFFPKFDVEKIDPK